MYIQSSLKLSQKHTNAGSREGGKETEWIYIPKEHFLSLHGMKLWQCEPID